MKFFVIDNRLTARAEIYGSDKPFETLEDAEHEADYQYSHMTAAEKKSCDAFYICKSELDDDGQCDFDSAAIVKSFI